MENDPQCRESEEEDFQCACFPVLTVTMVQCDSQTCCGKEDIFARFLCKQDLDFDTIDDLDLGEAADAACSKNHWISSDNGGKKIWVKEKVTADGNCYFRCVSKALTGVESFHPHLRVAIVNHMTENKDLYSFLIDGDVDAHMNCMMGTDGNIFTWATEAEVKATADFLGCDVYIQHQVGHSILWSQFKSDETFRQFEQYFLTIIYESRHYDIGRLINHTCNCRLTTYDMANYETEHSRQTSVNITPDRRENQIILWQEDNVNLVCSWDNIRQHNDVISVYLRMTLHLPYSLKSLPVHGYGLVIGLYTSLNGVQFHDKIHHQIWHIRSVFGNALVQALEMAAIYNPGKTNGYKCLNECPSWGTFPETYNMVLRLWYDLSRGNQDLYLEVLQFNMKVPILRKCQAFVMHVEDLSNS